MNINNFFNIDERLMNFDKSALEKSKKQFSEIDDITEYNQLKVLSAFIKNTRAMALYSRMGFRVIEYEGTTRCIMQRNPEE